MVSGIRNVYGDNDCEQTTENVVDPIRYEVPLYSYILGSVYRNKNGGLNI
jgi:hypothetical protein